MIVETKTGYQVRWREHSGKRRNRSRMFATVEDARTFDASIRARRPLPTFDDPIELAWLAGLLEGEGCFTVNTRLPSRQISVFVGGKDKDVIEHAAGLMTGTCRRRAYTLPSGEPSGYWTMLITGPRAALVMQAVLPLMGMRRAARIKEVLARFDGAPNGN